MKRPALAIIPFVMMGLGGILMLAWGCHPPSATLEPGERLYRGKCSSCHRLISPHEHDDKTWLVYVEKYGKNLSAAEKNLIMQYLRARN